MLLSDAISQYLADRRTKGLKASSLRSESGVLRTLLADVGNIQVHNLKPRHLDQYWSNHAHFKPATFNRIAAQLNCFFKWCQVRSYLPRGNDPMEGFRNQKVPTPERTIIPQGRFEELLDAADCSRNRVIVAIGLYLFTRVSETRSIRWQDVDFENKVVTIYREKTGQGDVLPMCEELEHELRVWRLAYGAEVGCPVKPTWYVCPPFTPPKYVSIDGRRAVERGTLIPTRKLAVPARAIKRTLGALELDALYEGGHTLRRSGAIALYRQLASVGHDRAIRMCQAMLGHSSISTTEVYLRLDLDRKARNDLLSGKRMFPATVESNVIPLGEAGRDGQKNA